MGCRTCTQYSNKLNYCKYLNDYLSIFDDLDKGCEVYKNCKEPTAQKMFEKLEYKNKIKYEEDFIAYFTNDYREILFDKKDIFFRQSFSTKFGISIEELKAINQQCKELGWL